MPIIQKVTDPTKRVTDPVLLSALTKQGIDVDYIEFWHDYAPRSLGKEHSPYAKFYRDLKSGKKFMVVSGLPMVKPDGTKIEVGWVEQEGNYVSKPNLFSAIVKGKQIRVICLSDQPDGRKEGAYLQWQPQLFLDGIEQTCGNVTLLSIDPINSNISLNTLEWDYGICKRRQRIIEGRIHGSWVFAQKPTGIVQIKYNQTGDYRLKLGQFAINDDEEQITPEQCDELAELQGYPVTVSDSATFYPDAHEETTSVDGFVGRQVDNEAWATKRTNAGNIVVDDDADYGAMGGWQCGSASDFKHLWRGVIVIDASALPDECTILAATLSGYGKDKLDETSQLPTLNIYSADPASNVELIAADYNIANFGSTPYCDTAITYANWNVGTPGAINDFSFNAVGIAAISKTVPTPFGVREATYDVTGNVPDTGISEYGYIRFWPAEAGAGYKPQLVITYTDHKLVTPPTLALDLTEYVPTVLTPRLVTPSTLALTLTAYVPVLKLKIIPPTLELALTTYAPRLWSSIKKLRLAPYAYTKERTVEL